VTQPRRLDASDPARLADLVAVADGAIVSRTLVAEAGGRIVLFAFDTGQALTEHTTPFEAVVQVLDGALAVTVGGERHAVRAGEVIRMPGGVPHALQAGEPTRMLLVMLARQGDA
jgi:quercetin dioxygenase-like cupin family protein